MAAAFGQKAQEDSRLGQGSIFDLGGGGGASGERAWLAHSTRRSALEEFDKRELLRLEKETLGTFLSSHPLAEVTRRAPRAGRLLDLRLESKADGSIVTVGGIVTEFKRIKTKRGDPMMFATLDDVEGQVEMLILGKAYEEAASSVNVDSVLIVRGRLDHKERGQTKLMAQELEPFEPTDDELARARAARAPRPARAPDRRRGFRRLAGRRVEERSSRTSPATPRCSWRWRPARGSAGSASVDGYRVAQSAALDAELDLVLGSGARAA